VIGIVSRANLIQALASLREEGEHNKISDSMIRKKVMKQFKFEKWSKGSLLNVTVQDGTVKLWGIVDSEAEKDAARVAAELVEGVQAIENNVTVLPVVAR
jgi:osmotically-inducible protein OsmY